MIAWIAGTAGGWLIVAGLFSLVIGRVIRIADKHEARR